MCSVPMHAASLAGVSSSKSIVGSERGWASARPCLPALAFSVTKTANPILLVDEVDKSESSINGDAVSALLPMLERETARLYPDIYLLGNLDLSRVSFVFTANSVAGMPQPFLDRVETIRIAKPELKHYPAIAASVVEEAALEFRIESDDDILEEIRDEALKSLEAGRSIRNVVAAVRQRFSKSVWSPPEGLRLVVRNEKKL